MKIGFRLIVILLPFLVSCGSTTNYMCVCRGYNNYDTLIFNTPTRDIQSDSASFLCDSAQKKLPADTCKLNTIRIQKTM